MIHYLPQAKKNNIKGTTAYYAQIAPITPLNLEDICTNITEVCTVTRHDVKCVLSALQAEIVKACQNGQSVRLGDLGSFRPTISGSGAVDHKDVKASMIQRVRCRFFPGALIHKRLALTNPEVQFGTFHIVTTSAAPESGGGGGGL